METTLDDARLLLLLLWHGEVHAQVVYKPVDVDRHTVKTAPHRHTQTCIKRVVWSCFSLWPHSCCCYLFVVCCQFFFFFFFCLAVCLLVRSRDGRFVARDASFLVFDSGCRYKLSCLRCCLCHQSFERETCATFADRESHYLGLPTHYPMLMTAVSVVKQGGMTIASLNCHICKGEAF